MCFHWVKAPTQEELLRLTHTLSHRVARFLEKQGLLERDVENSYLMFEQQEEDVMQQLYGHSVTYRIAVGPHQAVRFSHCKPCSRRPAAMPLRMCSLSHWILLHGWQPWRLNPGST